MKMKTETEMYGIPYTKKYKVNMREVTKLVSQLKIEGKL